ASNLPVVRVDTLERAGPDHLLGLVAENSLPGRALVYVDAVGIENARHVGGVLDQKAEVLFPPLQLGLGLLPFRHLRSQRGGTLVHPALELLSSSQQLLLGRLSLVDVADGRQHVLAAEQIDWLELYLHPAVPTRRVLDPPLELLELTRSRIPDERQGLFLVVFAPAGDAQETAGRQLGLRASHQPARLSVRVHDGTGLSVVNEHGV